MRRALPALILASLAIPAAAAAAPVRSLGKADTGFLTFAGERLVIWDKHRISTAGPDGRIVRRYRVDPPADEYHEIDWLAAGANRLAFVVFGSRDEGEGGSSIAWVSLRAGPLGGPFGVVAGEEREKFGPAAQHGPQTADVADNGIVYRERTSAGDRIMWLPDGGSATVFAEGRLGFDVAGRYLALARPDAIEVYDTTSGPGLVYRSALTGASASVQTDGSIVAFREDGFWTASPAEPNPVKRAEPFEYRALVGTGPGRIYVLVDRGIHLSQALAVDLATGAQAPVTPVLADHDNGDTSVTVDGNRLAFADESTGCLYFGDVPASEPRRWPVGRGCRPRMHNAVGDALSRDGKVDITLACPGATADRCAGRLQIRQRKRSQRWRTLSTRRFELAGGDTRDFLMRVPRRRGARQQLRIRMARGSTARGNDTVDLFFFP